MRTDWISEKAEARNSSLHGKGLFAVSHIIMGEKIVCWDKNIFIKANERPSIDGKIIMQWDENLFSIEDRKEDITYFINHSCDSNLWMQDAFTLIARKDISSGEELTADYTLWESDEKFIAEWTCKCGMQDCREKITGTDFLLLALQTKYAHHFSPLINKRIESINQNFHFQKPEILRDDDLMLVLIKNIPANKQKDYSPAYEFAMMRADTNEKIGRIGLRIGNNENIFYGVHIGYEVFEQYRGKHYAARSVRLLLPLALKHNINPVCITCNPENIASRKTCELAGGCLEEIVDLPENNEQYKKGERKKCRYRFNL